VRRAASAGAALVVCASCGFLSPSPLEAAADSLAEVRSGTLGFRLVAETPGGQEAGFFLRGTFALPEGAELPQADLTYGRVGVAGESETTFLATGDAAYVEVEGQAYELPPEAVGALVGAADPGEDGLFGELELDEWVREPEVTEGPPVGGDDGPSTVVEGDLDVVAALNDLTGLARAAGGFDLPPLEGDEAERLEAAVDGAHLKVVTDGDDVFRRLEIAVELGADAPDALAGPLEDLLGVAFELQVSIDDPNSSVTVDPPTDARPIEELVPDGLG
jgi:hypothetical protein